eukprot:TRINITY_DN3850_c0_g1_i4.p1 TRINITY_DN3850_c0_g1~~TRINITY_DN3850_c0_g1_i4.p1  ORF type:complete len:134 (+),score=27.33 TRINITY_DN3850_c0_g1_i4:52-453(+)
MDIFAALELGWTSFVDHWVIILGAIFTVYVFLPQLTSLWYSSAHVIQTSGVKVSEEDRLEARASWLEKMQNDINETRKKAKEEPTKPHHEKTKLNTVGAAKVSTSKSSYNPLQSSGAASYRPSKRAGPKRGGG